MAYNNHDYYWFFQKGSILTVPSACARRAFHVWIVNKAFRVLFYVCENISVQSTIENVQSNDHDGEIVEFIGIFSKVFLFESDWVCIIEYKAEWMEQIIYIGFEFKWNFLDCFAIWFEGRSKAFRKFVTNTSKENYIRFHSTSQTMGPLESSKYGEHFHELYINCLDNR